MNLIPNAGEVFLKSWAVRLAALASILAGLVAAIPSLPPDVQSLPYFQSILHWLTVASGIASMIARVIIQPNMPSNSQ